MMPPETPRSRNAAATREAILRAACARFGSDSYDAVGLRDIARDAGVDVALVGRYFGGKEELFRQVLRSGQPSKLEELSKPEDLPHFLADASMRSHGQDQSEHIERLILILRSASSPTAAGIVRQALEEDVLGPISGLLDGSEPDLRASLSLALLVGTTVLGTIMKVGPLCEGTQDQRRRRLERMLEAALSEDQPS